MRLDKCDVIFMVAFVLRVAGMWIPPLWYDENFTLILARLPFDRMLAATAGDVHPPLWYIIEWGWVRLFPDPVLAPAWTLRVPAFAFSLFAFVAFSHVLRELNIPERVRTVALMLMAILPMQIWYAQEARMYSLFELEVLLALLFALQRKYIGLFIASVAMLYTQNYSVFYLACIWSVVILKNVEISLVFIDINKNVIGKTTLAFLFAALCYLPWVNVIADQMTAINGQYWIQEQSIGDVLNTIYKLFWHASQPSFGLFAALLVTFMAVVLGVLLIIKSEHAATVTIMVMAFAPLFMAWIVSLVWQPILLFRPLIGSAPFLYLIAAWNVERLHEANQVKRWRETLLASALIIPVFVTGIGWYFMDVPNMKSGGSIRPILSALDHVKAHWQEGDVIYYTDDGPMISLSPYAGELPQYEMPVCEDRPVSVLGSLSQATRAAIGIQLTELRDLDFRRAWVFAPRSPLHLKCYEAKIAALTLGEPVLVVDDNDFISSGVWLVVKEKP